MTNTISRYHPEPKTRSASTRSRNTITCNICQAVYAPAQEYEYLLQAPYMALESAFMSMCHFCFRCRRPACPHCWDYVHGVCGTCTLEANLPFRSQGTPLRGIFFPPMRQIPFRHKRGSQTRLICIHAGRFQNVAPIDSAETSHIKTITTPKTSHQAQLANATQKIKTTQTQTQSSLPPTTRTITPPTTVNIDEIDTKPGPRHHPPIDEIDTKPGPRHHPPIDEIDTKPGPRHHPSIDEIDTKPGRRKSFTRHTERIITSILFALLLFIVLLIVLAEAFASWNAIILKLVHIDIRTEIAYIIQLIRQVFS